MLLAFSYLSVFDLKVVTRVRVTDEEAKVKPQFFHTDFRGSEKVVVEFSFVFV
jgi:hypothetical protein